MRCPKCNNNQRYSYGMTCSKCKYRFLINPKEDNGNDYKFKLVVDSFEEDQNITCYTLNQLHTEFINKTKPSYGYVGAIFAFGGFCVLGIFFLANLLNPSFNLVIIGVFMLALGRIAYKGFFHTGMSTAVLERVVKAWKSQHSMPKLLETTSLHEPPPSFEESDIYNYGTEGVLIVDHDIYVDLFVKNNYHLDWKVVVISMHGYPAYLQNRTQAILDQNPEIKIYYLHDAATDIALMKEETRKFLKFPSDAFESDLGLSPETAKHLELFKFGDYKREPKVDHLPPRAIQTAMGIALVSGILLGEALAQNNPGYVSDFG